MHMSEKFPSEAMAIVLPASLVATRSGAVAHLRISRPAKRNALDNATVAGMHAFFDALPADIRVVIISGDGEHFCAGLDLSAVVDHHDPRDGILHSRMWHRAFEAIRTGKVPVVSVLRGAVIGGGLELAVATHIRVAEQSAYYGLPEGQRGIFLGGGGSVRISRLIGVDRVQDMMLTGRTLRAGEGHAVGISQYLVDDGAGLDRARELAARIAANSTMTNFAVIQALPRIADMDETNGLFTESLVAAIAQTSPEAKQRLADFLEGRAAKVKPSN
jgi:(methylthio)acryloyl-CoA hydratase